MLSPLDALAEVPTSTQLKVAVDAIEADPDQPRRRFDTDKLAALAANMAETGQRDPIKVYLIGPGRYRIEDGERRWRAAQQCGWALIDALVVDHPDQPLPRQVAANELHQRLSAGELLDAVARLVDLGMNQTQISHHVARSRQWVNQACKLNSRHPDLVDQVRTGALSLRSAFAAAGILKPSTNAPDPPPTAEAPAPPTGAPLKKTAPQPPKPAHAPTREPTPPTEAPLPSHPGESRSISHQAGDRTASHRARLEQLVDSVEALVPELTVTDRRWLAGQLRQLGKRLDD